MNQLSVIFDWPSYDGNTVIKDVNLYANTLNQTPINLSEQYNPNIKLPLDPKICHR